MNLPTNVRLFFWQLKHQADFIMWETKISTLGNFICGSFLCLKFRTVSFLAFQAFYSRGFILFSINMIFVILSKSPNYFICTRSERSNQVGIYLKCAHKNCKAYTVLIPCCLILKVLSEALSSKTTFWQELKKFSFILITCNPNSISFSSKISERNKSVFIVSNVVA